MKTSTVCGCGRSKYFDADLCDQCWNKQRAYDERDRGNKGYCSCGNPKYPDADLCDVCWNRQSGWDDGRG